MFEGLPHPPEVSDELKRTIRRRRSRHRRDECLVELARPDEDWWLSFATDSRPSPWGACSSTRMRASCLRSGAPSSRWTTVRRRCWERGARRAGGCGSARRCGARCVRAASARRKARRLTVASRARAVRAVRARPTTSSFDATAEVGNWIMIGPERAPLGRALAAASGLRAARRPGRVGGARGRPVRRRHRCRAIGAARRSARSTPSSSAGRAHHGLAGDDRSRRAARRAGVSAARGQRSACLRRYARSRERLPGRREPAADARVLAIDRRPGSARVDQPCRQAVRGGAWSRPARAPRGARAVRGARAADVRARAGTRSGTLGEFARLRRAATRRVRGGEHEHARFRRSRPIRSGPGARRFIAEHDPWVAADALVRLQEIREEHAHAAGLVALSAATDAALPCPDSAAN